MTIRRCGPMAATASRAIRGRTLRYIYFVHPLSAAEFTFCTSTWGGRTAVSQLKTQVQTVRRIHPHAVPLVTFASATMPTKHGPKPRPQFDVVEWRNTADGAVPAIEPADAELGPRPRRRNSVLRKNSNHISKRTRGMSDEQTKPKSELLMRRATIPSTSQSCGCRRTFWQKAPSRGC